MSERNLLFTSFCSSIPIHRYLKENSILNSSHLSVKNKSRGNTIYPRKISTSKEFNSKQVMKSRKLIIHTNIEMNLRKESWENARPSFADEFFQGPTIQILHNNAKAIYKF